MYLDHTRVLCLFNETATDKILVRIGATTDNLISYTTLPKTLGDQVISNSMTTSEIRIKSTSPLTNNSTNSNMLSRSIFQ